MKRFNPSERHARPNQVVQIQTNITIKSPALNDKGAFQYLKSQPPTRHLKLVIGQGKYVGDINCVSAFVWTEDEPEILKAA
jgi:hypothetical protein